MPSCEEAESPCKVPSMQDEARRDLYLGLTDEERQVTQETLDRYLEVAWEIYEALQARDG